MQSLVALVVPLRKFTSKDTNNAKKIWAIKSRTVHDAHKNVGFDDVKLFWRGEGESSGGVIGPCPARGAPLGRDDLLGEG